MSDLSVRFPTMESYRAYLISHGWPVSLTHSEWWKEYRENILSTLKND
jgi:hypothetical protein